MSFNLSTFTEATQSLSLVSRCRIYAFVRSGKNLDALHYYLTNGSKVQLNFIVVMDSVQGFVEGELTQGHIAKEEWGEIYGAVAAGKGLPASPWNQEVYKDTKWKVAQVMLMELCDHKGVRTIFDF